MSTPRSGAAADAHDEPSGVVVSLYQKQRKIYPRSVTGWFAKWRWALVWLTQIVFYGLPWLQWGGRQAVLFDLEARRFYIFGLVLYPQDFIYLTGLLVISAYSLFLFTAVAGRLWCGYACPQTVYTEMFMWIERKFEGDRIARMKLDGQPWSFEKAWRKGGKQLVWVLLALFTGFTLVGYFTPIRHLAGAVPSLAFGPWEWFWILFYGLATYGNAGFLREQVCKYMCPYARFQSAMFDRDTLIISYDPERGEPRGSRSRKIADPRSVGKGDCVDCGLCVQVCPTGIDIRNGLQYECIGCAACIDVCNGVMDKMGYPQGLIRYDTENGLEQHLGRSALWRRVLRPRVLVYTAVLALITIGLGLAIALRTPFKVDVVKDRNSLGRMVDAGRIENVYRLQIMNSTETPQRYRISVAGMPGIRIAGQDTVELAPAEGRWVVVQVQVPPETAQSAGPGSHPMAFDIVRVGPDGRSDATQASVHEKSTFMVPR